MALLDEVESDMEDDIYELMNDYDTEFVFRKKNFEKYDVSNDQHKNILIPNQTFTVLKIECKIQRKVKKEVKKKDLMPLKQKKNLKDSQKKGERK